MVYFFTVTAPAPVSAADGGGSIESYTVYMGKNQSENELLIKYGHPEDVWFHVDNLSSAHVYLRMKSNNNTDNDNNNNMTIDDLHEELIIDCATLVKANSIAGCKKSETDVVYTRWKNLKKTSGMVDGQVGFHRPDNVHKIKAYKDNSRVKKIEKTKTEIESSANNVTDFLYKSQQDRIKEIQRVKKEYQRKQDKIAKQKQIDDAKEKELRSYDRLFDSNSNNNNNNNAEKQNNNNNNNITATGDSTAAEEYEDDFF